MPLSGLAEGSASSSHFDWRRRTSLPFVFRNLTCRPCPLRLPFARSIRPLWKFCQCHLAPQASFPLAPARSNLHRLWQATIIQPDPEQLSACSPAIFQQRRKGNRSRLLRIKLRSSLAQSRRWKRLMVRLTGSRPEFIYFKVPIYIRRNNTGTQACQKQGDLRVWPFI